jgi:hypothetical protein
MAPLDTPFDSRDPDFDRKMLAFIGKARCDMDELVSISKETVASTRVMLAEADRMLLQLGCPGAA